MTANPALPGFTDPTLKSALLAAGAAGTIYALVMPETESALQAVVDGGDRKALLAAGTSAESLDQLRGANWLDRYREPWTQKQDAMHESYFAAWQNWAEPVVGLAPASFPFRYPTAGASEGIYKLMAEHLARCTALGIEPAIHIFEGEYEGFPAYAAALQMELVRHRRDDWARVAGAIGSGKGVQFWISQPSAIDGAVWPHFEAFARLLAEHSPEAELIPDLTYIGCVARQFTIALDWPNVPAFVTSQSKPFGGYYQRAGSVFSRRESGSLFGNRWFKNLLSLAWAETMMERHGVFELPQRYRRHQEFATTMVGDLLGIRGLVASDVMVLATAPAPVDESSLNPVQRSVLRGQGNDRVLRLCLTPAMSMLIDPQLAGQTALTHPDLARRIAEFKP
jgi:hypothetical protein